MEIYDFEDTHGKKFKKKHLNTTYWKNIILECLEEILEHCESLVDGYSSNYEFKDLVQHHDEVEDNIFRDSSEDISESIYRKISYYWINQGIFKFLDKKSKEEEQYLFDGFMYISEKY